MLTLITGASGGFGRYLQNYMSTQTMIGGVEGVSRTTGHDIGTTEGRDKIVKMSHRFDIFINNAWSEEMPNAQCALFQELWYSWQREGKEGTIINIGSRAGTDIDQIRNPSPYHISKKRLLQLSDSYAQRRHPGIVVSCVNFGYFDTLQNQDHRYRIEYNRAAMLVNMIINFGPTIQIRNMTVEAIPYGS
jgi:NAD(P)-dependent dehydrogenase (short-subunit alcohol dehydrogenase family)